MVLPKLRLCFYHRRSGIALTSDNASQTIVALPLTTYGLTGLGREMSAPMLYGTLYLFTSYVQPPRLPSGCTDTP